MVARSIYILLCGLVTAGIVHICIVLMVPYVSKQDIAKLTIENMPVGDFQFLSSFPAVDIRENDPFFETAICRFDLAENSFLGLADEYPDFWSASVYDGQGQVTYSLNKNTAIKNQFRLLIVSPIQWAKLRKSQEPELERSIVVEMNQTDGFIVMRALVRDESIRENAREYLKSANCYPFESG